MVLKDAASCYSVPIKFSLRYFPTNNAISMVSATKITTCIFLGVHYPYSLKKALCWPLWNSFCRYSSPAAYHYPLVEVNPLDCFKLAWSGRKVVSSCSFIKVRLTDCLKWSHLFLFYLVIFFPSKYKYISDSFFLQGPPSTHLPPFLFSVSSLMPHPPYLTPINFQKNASRTGHNS